MSARRAAAGRTRRRRRPRRPAKPVSAGLRAIVVGAAPLPPGWLRNRLARLGLSARDLVIGVDGGVNALRRAGVVPSFAVGDWDSLRSARSLSAIPRASLPRDKDRSDLFFAMAAAGWAGATDLVALGVLGGRPDHHLAAIYELALAASSPRASSRISPSGFRTVQALGPEGEFHFISPGTAGWKVRLKRGQVISIFAPLGSASGICCRGLHYSGRLPDLLPSSWGLSNSALGGEASVATGRGVLLAVLPSPS